MKKQIKCHDKQKVLEACYLENKLKNYKHAPLRFTIALVISIILNILTFAFIAFLLKIVFDWEIWVST